MEGIDITRSALPAALANVLLVEDDSKMAELLRTALVQDNICLSTIPTAEEAFTLIDTNKVDLLILDLGLPGMDGYEVLKALQNRVSHSLLPVIVLTARHGTQDKLYSFELGAMDYVTKPFDVLELRARIRANLRIKRLHDALLEANEGLNAARIAAEEATRGKAAFLASMSHEIRTPMNGVIAMTGLLRETELRPEQREFVETIRTSGESLLGIIDDVLNISKIEAGKLELERRPLQLQACIEEALDILGVKAAEKGLDLMHEIDDPTPQQVIGDVTRLRQILVNLAGNAIKFTSTGEIAIEVQSKLISGSRYEIQFSVRDTGIGISADKISRLFQSYNQADSSTARHYGGTGLGLAISKGLVELMGGKIWVESKEGAGSSFRFTLPMEAVAQSEPQPLANAAGQKILIVEDNPSHGRALSKMVQKWGFQAVIASSTQEAAGKVHADKFDFVMLDFQIPGLPEGGSCSHMTGACPPVIGMTRMGTLSDANMGFYGVVTKPVKSSVLHNLLFKSQAKATAPSKPISVSDSKSSLSDQLPLQMLLAEDNVINQKVASRLLLQLGYKVDIANNGLEAIQALEKRPYDLVFMDVQMPILDGLEATRRIRQRQTEASAPEPFRQPIYIIAMTANAMQGDREKCIAAGMNDYLSKPVRPEALQEAIKRVKPVAAKCTMFAEPAIVAAPTMTKEEKPEMKKEIAQVIVRAPTVDIERLIEFSGGSQDNFNELVDLYIKQTAEQITTIRKAIEQKDSSRVSRVAHSCAGASSTCGMMAIVPLLRKLELTSKEGDLSEAPHLIEDITSEFAQIKVYLQDYQNTTGQQRKAI
jgi:signal transduction histidine kinase/HPt (histidine-containing phosphotransfer) domain-containing protein